MGRSRCSYPPHPSWHRRRRSRGWSCRFSFVISFVISLVRYYFLWEQAWAEGKGSLHRAAKRGLRRGNGLYIARHDLDRSHTRIMNKQKKKKITYFFSTPPISSFHS